MSRDPYEVLGVARDADPATIRSAYRRLAKLHHPDHNAGSSEAAERFEEIQEAYAAIARGATTGAGAPPPPDPGASSAPPPDPGASSAPSPDPGLAARIADLERQVREAQAARERAERAAREAAAAVRREAAAADGRERPTDEELGYVHTDDTIGQILSDARAELADRVSHSREHPVVRRVSDLIAGLEDLAEGLDRRGRGRDGHGGGGPDAPPRRRDGD